MLKKNVSVRDVASLTMLPRRTVWGSAVQTANYTRGAIRYVQYTTINEKYNIGEDVSLEPNEIPFPDYWGIGRGSTYMKVLSDGSRDTHNYIHEPVDAALFFQQPFILRTFDNDISPSQRKNYAIRTVVQVNGVKYIAYFLKKLNRTNTEVVAQIVVPATEDRPKDVKPIEGDARFLEPTPYEPTPGTQRTDGMFTNITSVVLSELTEWDVEEMINAKKILTGSATLEITEIGIFSAVTKEISSPSGYGNSTIQYNEAIKAQLNVTSPHRILINSYIGRGLVIEHDLGVSDPTNFQFIQQR